MGDLAISVSSTEYCAMKDQVATLTRERDEARAEAGRHLEQAVRQRAYALALRAQLAEIVAAAGPIAAMLAYLEEPDGETYEEWGDEQRVMADLTLGDLRRLRDAVAAVGEKEPRDAV